MKKCLKFSLISITVLVALIFCIPQNNFKVYASEYSYTADVVTDYDTTFLNGISSVDSVNFDYKLYEYHRFDGGIPININFLTTQSLNLLSTSSSYYFKLILLQLNYYDTVNYSSDCFNCSIVFRGNFYLSSYDTSSILKTYRINGSLDAIVVSDIFVCATDITPDAGFYNVSSSLHSDTQSFRNISINDSSLSDYLDMNSATNYQYNFSQFADVFDYSSGSNCVSFNEFCVKACNSKYDNEFAFYSGGLQNYNNNDLSPFRFCFLTTDGGTLKTTKIDTDYFSYNLHTNYYASLNNYTLKEYTVSRKLIIKNFEIKVNRPVYRTENTLVIYNYDYDCAVSSISSVEYALSKNGDTYKAKYTGSVPNSTTIGFVCEELQNRLYDEYIYIYLTFNNNQVDFSNTGQFSLGFDFNFSRFYEPLVIDTSSDFDSYGLPSLNKPNHWYDFGGWIDYATKWVFFYNPIVKPVSKVIGSIFSMLVVCVKFLVDLPLGGFVLSFIGFMVFYKLLSAFMPSFSPKSVVNLTTNVFEKTSSSYKEQKELERQKQELARYNHDKRYRDYKNGNSIRKELIERERFNNKWEDFANGTMFQKRQMAQSSHKDRYKKYKQKSKKKKYVDSEISSFYDNMIGWED